MAEPSKGGFISVLSYLLFPMFIFACFSGLVVVVFTALGMEKDGIHEKLQDVHASHLLAKSTTMIFSENPQYQNLSPEFDQPWDELLTPNGGFIMTKDEKHIVHQHGLSMFHQLHCLSMIRTALQKASGLKGNISSLDSPHEHQVQEGSLSDEHAHWLHCFDYLRQTILCQADSKIEPPRLNTQGHEVVDGMGERQCKDWTTLWNASIKSDDGL